LPGAGAAPIIRKGMPSAPIYPAPIGPEEKARLLGDMDQREVRGCQKCGLCRGRTHTVFGEGDPNARLMFVGEGPGQAEDEQGRPFVGRAGQLLDKQIKAMGFQREKVYIANVVKCRPPNNRAPLPEEAQACWGYLKRQIATIQPSVIIALGRPAANQLLNNPSVGIMSMRGQWHLFEGLSPDGPPIPTMPTYHPSYILRRYEDVNTRRRVWEDLQKVMAYLKEHPEPGRP
jgi:DNA polymerase